MDIRKVYMGSCRCIVRQSLSDHIALAGLVGACWMVLNRWDDAGRATLVRLQAKHRASQ